MKRHTDPEILLLQAAADPIRLAILRQLALAGPVCACDIAAGYDVTQPTVSHHLARPARSRMDRGRTPRDVDLVLDAAGGDGPVRGDRTRVRSVVYADAEPSSAGRPAGRLTGPTEPVGPPLGYPCLAPEWRNGRRSGLKLRGPQGRPSSNLGSGTNVVRTRGRVRGGA